MKLKKWLATALAALMAVGTMGVFAACGDNPAEPENPNNPSNPSNPSDDTAIQYYLVGKGLGTLAISNWDQTNTDESLKFTRTGNILTITADLYEGDVFQIVHNQDWAGQMGADILTNEGKDAEDNQIFEGVAGGGGPMNIQVAEGQSGKYELTVTLNSESDYGSNTLTWERLEKYDVVFVSWYASDDTTEPEKTVVKKNTTTTSRTQTTTKRFYEFDKWVKKDGQTETAFDFTQPLTENVDLYATYKEVANANYHEDESTWTIKIDNEVVATFAKNTEDYAQHNVYTVSYQFDEGDEFVITNGTTANAGITMPHAAVFPDNTDGNKYKAAQGANYQFTLITDVDANKTVTVNELFFEELKPLYSGLAIVGGFDGTTNWNYVEGINPKLTETEAGSGIYTGTITTTTDHFEMKVATVEKGIRDWNLPNWGEGGLSGQNYVIETAGTYIVTVNTTTNTLTVVSAVTEYIFVGKWLAAQGNGGNWGYDGTNPKLTETAPGSGIYEGTITTDIENAEVKVCSLLGEFSWDAPNWGTEKNGSQEHGDNVSLEQIGTYKFTLNVAENLLTWQKV